MAAARQRENAEDERDVLLGRRVRAVDTSAEGFITEVSILHGGDGRTHVAEVLVALLDDSEQPRECERFPLWALEDCDGRGLPDVDRAEVERLQRLAAAGEALIGKWYVLRDGRSGKATKYRDGPAGSGLELRFHIEGGRFGIPTWLRADDLVQAVSAPPSDAGQERDKGLSVLVGRRVEYVAAGEGGDLRHERYVGLRGTILHARRNSTVFRRPRGLPFARGEVQVMVAFDTAPEGETPDTEPYIWLDGCRLLRPGDEPEREQVQEAARRAAASWVGARVRVKPGSQFGDRWGVVVEAALGSSDRLGGAWPVVLSVAFDLGRMGGPLVFHCWEPGELEQLTWSDVDPDDLARLIAGLASEAADWRDRATAAEARLDVYGSAMGDLGRVFKAAMGRVGAAAS
jgi:hypothetical protein